jgi:hypothetical protein
MTTDSYLSWLTPTPSPASTGPTPPDVVWCIGDDAPVPLCWPCKRRLGLSLLDSGNRKEPYTERVCEQCKPKPEQMEMELSK